MLLIYVPCGSNEEAVKIASLCLEQKYIACANIMPPHQSLYVWDGELCNTQEVLLLMKTTDALYKTAEKAILEIHSYDTPCVLALDIADGAAPFLHWIEQSVGNI